MSHLQNKISYIVCYRESGIERKKALVFTISRFRQYFPDIEIIIVEQDLKTKLAIDKNLNVRHLFLYNPGLFNRSWAFNCATKNIFNEILIFTDADIFLEKEGYIECFNAAENFEAITPNKLEISNVSIGETDDQITFLNKRKLHSFAGGMLIITKKAFQKIGGWDERFEGWGGEDDAMSHVIYNLLRSQTLNTENYHIDHPHEHITGNNHPRYESNKALLEEIVTRNGPSLYRYVHQLKTMNFGNHNKYVVEAATEPLQKRNLIFAVTTYNRLGYLKKCVTSFLQTRNETYSWQLIIADDNSTDGTKEYLDTLEKEYDAIIIRNNRASIHHQVNTILKTLSNMTFDICFKSDDDIEFLQKGWDDLYFSTMLRTNYDHLIFYDKSWLPHANLSRPIISGNLISNCIPKRIQGAFYTITPEVIDKVGYFDEQQFGASGLGHIDYSFRCCRAGFNVLSSPFDVMNSNQLIQLQSVHSYVSATSSKKKVNANSKSKNAKKEHLLKMDRLYIPYNENTNKNAQSVDHLALESKEYKRRGSSKYKKADATFYPERGIGGFLGWILKRIYNLSIDLRLYFIPLTIKFLGTILNKISIHLINIEK
ncbi:MAG: glycosyltransferase involved in cell wall biosynthesis [Saprospiraceae bacterium]|jgi:glycosyltransferase involved in cell wall biosynthesis